MNSVYNYLEPINNGVTRPVLVSTNDEQRYVIKFINEDCNGKILFNELISYRLAKLLDVPVPDCCLLKLNQEIINKNQYLKDIKAKPCVCFASKYLKGNADISPVFLNNSINLKDLPAIVLFDQIIINQDRTENPGNLFYDRKEKKVVAIDHSHVFKNGMIWTAQELNDLAIQGPQIINNMDGKTYKIFSKYINGNSPFHSITEKVKEIDSEKIKTIFDDIPDEWDISLEEKESVMNLISCQIDNIDSIVELMKPYFVHWKGK